MLTLDFKLYSLSGPDGIRGAESDMIYILTEESFPDPPQSLLIEKTNFSSLNISWVPPEAPNGIIDHYEIILQMKKTNVQRALDRNYCKDGFKVNNMAIAEEKDIIRTKEEKSELYSNGTVAAGMCPCDTCVAPKPIKIIENQRKFDVEFDNRIINIAFNKRGMDGKKRKRRTVVNDDGTNEIREDFDEEDIETALGVGVGNIATNALSTSTSSSLPLREIKDDDPRYAILSKNEQEFPRPFKSVVDVQGGDYYYWTYTAKVPGDKLFSLIAQLRHYGSYTLKLRACHAYTERQDNSGNNIFSKRCSKSVVKDVRILHKSGADDIPVLPRRSEQVEMVQANDTESAVVADGGGDSSANGASVAGYWITWRPPTNPNELIVNYNVEIKMSIDQDVVHTSCVTAKDFKANNYKYKLEFPGTYYVSVQAVSVYGPGSWTDPPTYVTVNTPGTVILTVVLTVIAFLVAVFGFVVCFWVRHKNQDQFGLVDSCPLYDRFVYQLDGWEVERTKVEVGRELGSGTFGTVFDGIFHSDSDRGVITCAIKAVREDADPNTVKQFLSEAEFMKPFETEHVVKLVGVVSANQPHLILMELMSNGDLRKYLMKHRPNDEANPEGRKPPKICVSFCQIYRCGCILTSIFSSTHRRSS
jgi:hypothetical protein